MTDQEMFRRWELEEWQLGQRVWQQEAPESVSAALREPGPGIGHCKEGRSSASEETRET